MLFPTFTFAIFFLVVFVGSWLLMPRQGLWKPFILLASVVFYGWWDWRFVFLLAFSAVANQLFAKAIERAAAAAARKWLLAATVAVNLGVLGWFKYYGFFITSVANTGESQVQTRWSAVQARSVSNCTSAPWRKTEATKGHGATALRPASKPASPTRAAAL